MVQILVWLPLTLSVIAVAVAVGNTGWVVVIKRLHREQVARADKAIREKNEWKHYAHNLEIIIGAPAEQRKGYRDRHITGFRGWGNDDPIHSAFRD